MTEKLKARWAIESSDSTVNISVLYQTLNNLNMAVDTVEFPDDDPAKDGHNAIEVKFKLINMIASKKHDLKKKGLKIPYHVWRKKGDAKWTNVDDIFKTKLSAKAKEAQKWIQEKKKTVPF